MKYCWVQGNKFSLNDTDQAELAVSSLARFSALLPPQARVKAEYSGPCLSVVSCLWVQPRIKSVRKISFKKVKLVFAVNWQLST